MQKNSKKSIGYPVETGTLCKRASQGKPPDTYGMLKETADLTLG